MPGFDMPPGIAPAQPKQISSRLLNMKFMQRAQATTTQKNASAPSTPSNEPAAKRRRTGDFSATASSLNSPAQTPSASGTPVYGDRTAISSSLKAEANGASIRRGTNNFDAQGEETEWVLDVRIPTSNGANVDSEEEESEDEIEELWSATAPRGRQTYGSFNKKARKSAASNSGGNANTTPSSTTTSAKKRSRPEDEQDDEELSSVPSDFEDDNSEEGAIQESPHPKKKKFNFQSDVDLKKMDSMNFQKAGFEGLGRQRPGLSGASPFGAHSSAHGQGQSRGRGHGQGRQKKKKARKTM